MRVLFASTQGAGHFRPLVPFIDACLRNGHEALVVGPPALDAKGYPFRAGAHPPDKELGPLWGSMPRRPPGQGDVIVVGTIFARLNVRAMLPTLRETIGEWEPDLVLREGSEFASAAAAELHGVPHARVANGLATVEEANLAIAAPTLDEVVPGLAARIAASAWLTALPESVDRSPFPVRRFRDPGTERDPEPIADWWPGDERPLVYVSFGSVAASFPPAAAVYPQALQAAGELDARVLFTTGGGELELGPTPANVRVERWISNEADVVAQSSVVVSHGGSGRWSVCSRPAPRSSSCRSSPTSRRTRCVSRQRAPEWSRPRTGYELPSSACSVTARTGRRLAGSPARCARYRRSTTSTRTTTARGSPRTASARRRRRSSGP